jgi:hypothetical protein
MAKGDPDPPDEYIRLIRKLLLKGVKRERKTPYTFKKLRGAVAKADPRAAEFLDDVTSKCGDVVFENIGIIVQSKDTYFVYRPRA